MSPTGFEKWERDPLSGSKRLMALVSMGNPRQVMDSASMARHVSARFRVAMEHDSPEALAKYLKEHPDADKGKHSVKKPAPSKGKKAKPPTPHALRDTADAAAKSGDHAKAFDQYSAAAEMFRRQNSPEAAQSMDNAAKEQAQKWKKKQPKK